MKREKILESEPNKILRRLNNLKELGRGKWMASCPSHDDNTPSLSIRETDEGAILLHCFGGCGTPEVLESIGLEMADLFPDRDRWKHSKPLPAGQRWVPRDVLLAISGEALIVLFAAEEVRKGRQLQSSDINRLALSVGRIRQAVREVGYDV